ncbi:MAG: VWA domain-containing protein [Deltaproteobacteria bacterium]|nr:MAG: VWA domain-containing protein [Deltaproteobacteria bacterium]
MSAAPPGAGEGGGARRTLLFGRLFFGLRGAGLPVGVGEWMALMELLSRGVIAPDLTDFYRVARAVLIKHEAQFDTWDQVFTAVFGGGQLPTKAAEELLSWLEDPLPFPELTAEQLAALETLPLDELRRLFEERLAEQTERHDGGNKWIGTGGTSPFGHGGRNPAGVRVGGSGGSRSAIQIAGERRFRDYRSDRVLDTRQLAVALRRLRRLSRAEGEPELDVEESVDRTCKNAGFLELAFTPPRENQAKVLLLMDVGGSMTPFTRMVETLFSAASHLNHWKRFDHFFFHNCPYSRLFESVSSQKVTPTSEVVRDKPRDTFLIMVGDASMAPSELLSPYGAIDYFEHNETPGLKWLHLLRSHFTRSVWLNPIPAEHWRGYTLELIAQLFPMFPLTLNGLDQAVDHLVKRTHAPPPDLDPSLFRALW